MKRTFSLIVLMAVMCSCLAMTAHAADYSFYDCGQCGLLRLHFV